MAGRIYLPENRSRIKSTYMKSAFIRFTAYRVAKFQVAYLIILLAGYKEVAHVTGYFEVKPYSVLKIIE